MANSRGIRLVAITLANVLLPLAIFIFASGFFPYKPFLPGLAVFEDVIGPGEISSQPPAVFERVIFMVVDALRSDFVYGHQSGFAFTQSLIRSGAAIPFTAHATPPTVTMPRVKALTTGSVPSFLDVVLNLAEDDTSSTLSAQDTWLAQLRARGGRGDGRIVFYGDDTWLKLFPEDGFFARVDGTSSFFVSDFTEVDLNVTRHVPAELSQSDWSAMIMHYLGLDHIGHKTGPQGPQMLPKQREMDSIVRSIYDAMETMPHHEDTLLVLAGDHGMNGGGNHGGSGPGETEPALLFVSPKLRSMKKKRNYESPTRPRRGTEFHYYSKIQQSDLVPTLAGLMGFPVSKNSLGVFIPELSGLWDPQEALQILRQNAKQMLGVTEATYGSNAFRSTVDTYMQETETPTQSCNDGDEHRRLACLWARAEVASSSKGNGHEAEEATMKFLVEAQNILSNAASSYNIPRMVGGLSVMAVILVLSLLSLPSLWPPTTAGFYFAATNILYLVMMFASSYVEEEQHIWYWLTPGWILLLCCGRAVTSGPRMGRARILLATVLLLGIHRLAVRWNQTGQKHASEPDIVHTFFPDAHVLMWLMILASYTYTGFFLARTTFAGLVAPEIALLASVTLVLPAIVFKLNFTQADAPELVQGLAFQIRDWSAPFDLVLQAKFAFAMLAIAVTAVIVLSTTSARVSVRAGLKEAGLLPSLSERLHHLLTLFLMTQTRAPNVPLLLGMEIQLRQLRYLEYIKADSSRRPVLPVATTSLLLSHVYFFCFGGSNSISSIDVSNSFNGVSEYNIVAVGVLLFAGNWAGPIWWCSAANILLTLRPVSKGTRQNPQANGGRPWIEDEHNKLHDDAVKTLQTDPRRLETAGGTESWLVYVSAMTVYMSVEVFAVMAACTALRTHLFIWTVFSPKLLYSVAWSVLWHIMITIGLGSLLHRLSGVS